MTTQTQASAEAALEEIQTVTAAVLPEPPAAAPTPTACNWTPPGSAPTTTA